MNSVMTPEIEENRTFNLLTSIWIVPVIALIVSGWLVYQHYSKIGSEISIDFPSSNGLISGESVVKFRNVVIGKVVRIKLQPNGKGVTIIARMSKEADPYLNKMAHFWIAKPRVDYQGVRGVDTIINGSYIDMYGVRGEKETDHFIGDLKPFRDKDEGFYVHLFAYKLDTIHAGAPVYFRNLEAGTIESIHYDKKDKLIKLLVFLKKPFKNLINTSTRFWTQGLLKLEFKDDAFVFRVAPLATLIWGSIAFDSRLDKEYPPLPSDKELRLYYGKSDIVRQQVGSGEENWHSVEFVFRGQVNGLKKGAPISFEGFRVGEVEAVDTYYNHRLMKVESKVIGKINVGFFKETNRTGTENIIAAVANGLHGELKSITPLLSSLYIDLNTDNDVNTSRKLIANGDRWIFPTKTDVDGAIISQLDHLLSSISALSDETKEPWIQLLEKLKKSIENINRLTEKQSFYNLTDDLNKTMGSLRGMMGGDSDLSKAIADLRKTLKTTKSVLHGYSSGSLFGKKLEAMLREVGRTSEETKRFIQKLNKKPNALIFGE